MATRLSREMHHRRRVTRSWVNRGRALEGDSAVTVLRSS